ncbi:MAG: sulfite exporter TauE/SafE family protein [Methanobacterium paludis]|nr:sulfite exporter TauE/SafE family protein [Methanobacterium paludis]
MDVNLILLPLFGFLIGLLVSMLGGGGGGLYVPVLTLLFGVPTQVAVATSLASVLPTTAVGALSHHREGNVDIRTGLILGIGGIIGTVIGAYIANMIPPIDLGSGDGRIVRAAAKMYHARDYGWPGSYGL